MEYCQQSRSLKSQLNLQLNYITPLFVFTGFKSATKKTWRRKASQGYKQKKRDLNNLNKLHEIIGCNALCVISHYSSFPCCQSFDPLPDMRQRSGRYRKLGSWSREEWADKSNTISKELPKNNKIRSHTPPIYHTKNLRLNMTSGNG